MGEDLTPLQKIVLLDVIDAVLNNRKVPLDDRYGHENASARDVLVEIWSDLFNDLDPTP